MVEIYIIAIIIYIYVCVCVRVCIYICIKCLIQDTKEVCLYKEQFKQPVGPNQPGWGVPHPHFPCSLLSHSLSVHGKVCLTKLPVTHFLSRPYTCTGPWCHGRLSSWTRTARCSPPHLVRERTCLHAHIHQRVVILAFSIESLKTHQADWRGQF